MVTSSLASRPAVSAAALAEAVASRPAVPAAAPASVVVARQAAAAAGATVLAPEERGAAASTPRGRAQDKAAAASRPSSLAPGDSTGVICYARFVALLGSKMENVTACAGLLNKYFKGKVKQSAFVSDNGSVRVPLTVNPNFAWKTMSNKFLNCNVRRDIYAAWNVLRDRCSGKAFRKPVPSDHFKESVFHIGRVYYGDGPQVGSSYPSAPYCGWYAAVKQHQQRQKGG